MGAAAADVVADRESDFARDAKRTQDVMVADVVVVVADVEVEDVAVAEAKRLENSRLEPLHRNDDGDPFLRR